GPRSTLSIRERIHGGGGSRPRHRQGGTMQHSLHYTAIVAAALGLAACAAPGDAFAPRAPISSDLAAGPLAHAVQVTGGGTTTFGDIPFVVAVTPGGPGVATLQLTVLGVFEGVAGDVAPANGNYDLARETLTTGQITIH